MDNNKNITLKCDRCGTDISIQIRTYNKTKDKPHYCRSCRGKNEHERITNMSESERAEYLNKKNQHIRDGWNKQDADKKKEISNVRKELWKNPDRRNQHFKQMQTIWDSLSDEEKANKIKLLNAGKISYWSDINNRVYHSKRARDKWYAQSKEEQERILKALEDGRQAFYNSLSASDKIELQKKKSEGLKRYWDNISEEEYEQRMNVFHNALKSHFDDLNLYPNKNETDFINRLNVLGIQYEFIYYNKTKHPDFDLLFPSNPVRPNLRVSPYHAWDFKLLLKDAPVLVDIDGSIHDSECASNTVTDSNGNKFILSEYIKFKDSQRQYQTDGLDAYAILCYDNNLTDDTIVLNINTNARMKFSEFMAIVTWMNISIEEKLKMINK